MPLLLTLMGGAGCREQPRKAFQESSLQRSRMSGDEVEQAPAGRAGRTGRPSGLPAAAAARAASTMGWTQWSPSQTQPSCRYSPCAVDAGTSCCSERNVFTLSLHVIEMMPMTSMSYMTRCSICRAWWI